MPGHHDLAVQGERSGAHLCQGRRFSLASIRSFRDHTGRTMSGFGQVAREPLGGEGVLVSLSTSRSIRSRELCKLLPAVLPNSPVPNSFAVLLSA
jgi:hypothetical protein